MERSTRFQLAMELYSSTSTLAVIELEVNRYGRIEKKKIEILGKFIEGSQESCLTSNTEAFAL